MTPYSRSLDQNLPSPNLNLSESRKLTSVKRNCRLRHHPLLSGRLQYFPIQLAAHCATPCVWVSSKAANSLVMVIATAKTMKMMKL